MVRARTSLSNAHHPQLLPKSPCFHSPTLLLQNPQEFSLPSHQGPDYSSPHPWCSIVTKIMCCQTDLSSSSACPISKFCDLGNLTHLSDLCFSQMQNRFKNNVCLKGRVRVIFMMCSALTHSIHSQSKTLLSHLGFILETSISKSLLYRMLVLHAEMEFMKKGFCGQSHLENTEWNKVNIGFLDTGLFRRWCKLPRGTEYAVYPVRM